METKVAVKPAQPWWSRWFNKKKKKAKTNSPGNKNWGYMQNKKTVTNRLDGAFAYQDKKKK